MKFNTASSTIKKTENYAGGEAFKQTPELEFISILLTSFVEDQFYRSKEDTLEQINALIDNIPDKKFAAKSAIYARTKFGMRSISHAVAAELAKRVKGEPWTKNFFNKVVYRPDDMVEIMAYYLQKYQKPIPNSLKKGLALAFNKFDGYQLAKYRAEKKAVSLVDIVNLVKPKPNKKNEGALKQLVKDALRSTDTWETKLTEAGKKAKTEEQKEELKQEAWEQLIKEKKLGYFALLRNLRNIIEQSPKVLPQALKLLVDSKVIKKSLVLPFRFTTAYEEIQKLNGDGVRDTIVALDKALEVSLDNVPELPGRTLVAVDGSGSMTGRPQEIAALFGAVLAKVNKKADVLIFSNDAKYLTINPLDSLLTIAEKITEAAPSSGTNFHSIFEEANQAYDRIIILSDEQGWIGYNPPTTTFADYKKRLGVNSKVYSIDLQGYGTLQLPEQDVYCLAGFSEKIFDIMKILETDKKALLSEINKIEL